MARIIGIDLGTTNTAVAVLDGGRPRVLEDERGYKVLPSVVSAKGEGRFVVGQAAANLILTRPDRTVYATKRLIGRRFDSPEVQRVRERVHFELREAQDGGVEALVGDTWMTPQEVAAVVLQVARGIAEKALGEAVEEAVITVPAHFTHAQRSATLEAAHLAGLHCERLLNEPTAAALAYGHRKNVDRTLVVFDLGGGTFDVSVLRLRDGIYEILATGGDTFLGGEDFDYRVVDFLADEFQARSGVDLRKDRQTLHRLKDAAERAKCELSFSDNATLVVPHVAPGKNLETVLARTKLESLTSDLVDRCVAVVRDSVASAGLSVSEIDDVILVGGMTRMPRLREAVAGLFGREPSRGVHPEEAVAIGAAVHAANLEDVDGPRPVLLDVIPFDLGIDAIGGLFSTVIPRNSRIPCSETKIFATVHDNQESVKITVRQGESRTANENEFLGEFVFDGLPPAPKLGTKVSVTFRIDHNGMLHVAATDPATGGKRNIVIRNYAEHAKSPSVAPVVVGADAPARAAPAKPAKADAASKAADAGTAKKTSLLDAILGRRGKGKAANGATVATAPGATTPPETSTGATASADATPAAPTAAASPATAGAPPVGAFAPPGITLPEPMPMPDDGEDDEPLDGLVEFDEAAPLITPIEEDDLYGHAAGPASFGLAGAHEVGAASHAAGLFGDAPARTALDATDLFGDIEAPADDDEDDQDAPTNPGLRAKTAGTARPAARPPEPARPDARPPEPARPAVHEEDAFALPEDDAFALGGDAFALGDDAFALAEEVAPARALDTGLSEGDLFAMPDDEPTGGRLPSPRGDRDAPASPSVAAPAPGGAEGGDPFRPAAAPVAEEDAPFAFAAAPVAEEDDDAFAFAAFDEPAAAPGAAADLAAPDLAVPPDLAAPDLAAPDLGTPDLAAPDLAERDSAEHDLAAPLDFGADLDVDLDAALAAATLAFAEPAPPQPAPAAVPPPRAAAVAPPRPAPPEPAAADATGFALAGEPEEEPTGFQALDPFPGGLLDEGEFRVPDDLLAEPVEDAPTAAERLRLSDVSHVFAMPDDDTGEAPRPGFPKKKKKPARIKLQYREWGPFVDEYRENLRRRGAFIRTDRPLPVGRECVFEVGAPGLPEPLVFGAVVSSVSDGRNGAEMGMHVAWTLDDAARASLERALRRAG